jgi:hypothetical protein
LSRRQATSPPAATNLLAWNLIMDHRIFGQIQELPYKNQWFGRLQIDFFTDFNAVDDGGAGKPEQVEPKSTPGEGARGREFELSLIGGGPGGPSSKQEKAFLDFLKNRDKICNRVVDAIYDHYRCHWGYWRTTVPPGRQDVHEYEAGVPELHSRAGLKNLIVLQSLSVVDLPEHTDGILGFCFGCTWDPEHGLGVLLRRRRVVEIGENDITWREFGGKWDGPRKAATKRRINVQHGLAAIKRLGGRVKDEHGEAEIELPDNERVEDADLAALRYFPNPCQLQLASPRITNDALKLLQRFKNLRVLDLSRAAITDAGLKRLRRLKHLKALYLNGTRITDAGLKELRRLPELSGLHLGDTSVTDEGMKEIGAFTGLKFLDLSGTGITDAGIDALKGLRTLRSLDLRGTSVTDSALTSLTECADLRYLTLSRCNITDIGLEQLKVLKALRSLKLESTSTTDGGVAGLQQAIDGLQVVR